MGSIGSLHFEDEISLPFRVVTRWKRPSVPGHVRLVGDTYPTEETIADRENRALLPGPNKSLKQNKETYLSHTQTRTDRSL